MIGDIFADSPGPWFAKLTSKIDIIYAASIFHLFNWDGQVCMAKRDVSLLRPVKGSVVLGRQRGNISPAEYEYRTNQGGTLFRYNEESWKKIWSQIGEITETFWDVKIVLRRVDDELYQMQASRTTHHSNKLDVGDGSLRFETVRL